ncbi:amphi-Trp domain-containing protein [Desulfoluna spongiiphila]|uniref:Amphi-Trp domain-containing protein n=1 Tax=Desulfoluna spongiiphila TaxID=419481 RepID=A0A1G5ANY3_9BACT|nr:amphi-Trp domain-containing protein [Desulfoluna spongiiphila]SCX79623.1 amphi-Trp domain-containing protein [Desulfoluna spongiiphila]VVS91909.1 amphi-trp domain [Desulfoluna spongiiphila]
MSDDTFVFDSLQDNDTITRFLASLTEGFRKGEIALSGDGVAVDLHPEGLLNFTVKAKKKAGRTKLSITISWRDNERREGQVDPPLTVR